VITKTHGLFLPNLRLITVGSGLFHGWGLRNQWGSGFCRGWSSPAPGPVRLRWRRP